MRHCASPKARMPPNVLFSDSLLGGKPPPRANYGMHPLGGLLHQRRISGNTRLRVVDIPERAPYIALREAENAWCEGLGAHPIRREGRGYAAR